MANELEMVVVTATKQISKNGIGVSVPVTILDGDTLGFQNNCDIGINVTPNPLGSFSLTPTPTNAYYSWVPNPASGNNTTLLTLTVGTLPGLPADIFFTTPGFPIKSFGVTQYTPAPPPPTSITVSVTGPPAGLIYTNVGVTVHTVPPTSEPLGLAIIKTLDSGDGAVNITGKQFDVINGSGGDTLIISNSGIIDYGAAGTAPFENPVVITGYISIPFIQPTHTVGSSSITLTGGVDGALTQAPQDMTSVTVSDLTSIDVGLRVGSEPQYTGLPNGASAALSIKDSLGNSLYSTTLNYAAGVGVASASISFATSPCPGPHYITTTWSGDLSGEYKQFLNIKPSNADLNKSATVSKTQSGYNVNLETSYYFN